MNETEQKLKMLKGEKLQAKSEAIANDMQQQSQFFELRHRAMMLLLQAHPWRSAVWCWRRANQVAKLDYLSRVEEAAAMMKLLGDEMKTPTPALLLQRGRE